MSLQVTHIIWTPAWGKENVKTADILLFTLPFGLQLVRVPFLAPSTGARTTIWSCRSTMWHWVNHFFSPCLSFPISKKKERGERHTSQNHYKDIVHPHPKHTMSAKKIHHMLILTWTLCYPWELSAPLGCWSQQSYKALYLPAVHIAAISAQNVRLWAAPVYFITIYLVTGYKCGIWWK